MGYTSEGTENSIFAEKIDSAERTRWYAIVNRVFQEFRLDKPLFNLSGEMLDRPVPLPDEREAQITVEAFKRTNLPAGVADLINRGLNGELEKYRLRRADGYYDIRIAVMQRLIDLLQQHSSLPIKVSMKGLGAINMSVYTPLEAYEKLLGMGVLEQLAGGPIHDNEIMLLGRRKPDFGTHMPRATAIVFNLYQPPDKLMNEGVRLFQGPPGSSGLAKFMDALLSGPQNHPHPPAGALSAA